MADTIPGNTSSFQALTVGTSATSAIDFNGDTDWWRVTLQGGFAYQVWVEGFDSGGGSLGDPFLAIYNSAGVFQHGNDNASFLTRDAYTSTVPNSTGTFFISAEEFGNNATGTYTITLWLDQLASTATAATVTAGVSAESRLGCHYNSFN